MIVRGYRCELMQTLFSSSPSTQQMVEHASARFISGITHLKYALKVMDYVLPLFQHIAVELRWKKRKNRQVL